MDENGDGRVMRSEAKKYREKAAEREPPQTVSALKAKLTEMGLSTKGVKSELMARLNDGETLTLPAKGCLVFGSAASQCGLALHFRLFLHTSTGSRQPLLTLRMFGCSTGQVVWRGRLTGWKG